MIPDAIRRKRDELAAAACRVRWCDDRGLEDENREDASPGGHLNPLGWYVVGTTTGGNAIVVRADDPGVYFADRTCWRAVPAGPDDRRVPGLPGRDR